MDSVVTSHGVSKRFRLQQSRPRSIGEALHRLVRRHPSAGRVSDPATDDYLWALRDVSFSVEAGQGLALVGHNGSGKSTMLKMIAGIFRPTAGRIEVRGRISPLIELAAGFHPDFTGRENVYLNGLILGLSRNYIDQRFSDIVEFSGVERFIDVPVKYYSSGMYMRLAFSVATQIQPDVLLVDEVLAVGDELFQKKCIARILEMKGSGTALLFVSHARNLVGSVCDDVVWLERGNVRFRGTVGEYLQAPGEVGLGAARSARLIADVLDARGDPACWGRGAGECVHVRLRVDSAAHNGWRAGLHLVQVGAPVIGGEPSENDGVTLPGDGEALTLRVTGLDPSAGYVLRAWAVAEGEVLWSEEATFGLEQRPATRVSWARVAPLD